MAENRQIYRLAVLGDGGVGKTALVLQYITRVFTDYHDPTVEDGYQAQVVVDGEVGKLEILDTAGQEELTMNTENHIRYGHGFVLVYSITDRHSFQRLRGQISMMQRLRYYEKLPVVLVGNKIDLQKNRQVSWNTGFALSKELECPFFESSAATRENVDNIFAELIRVIRRTNRELSSDDLPDGKQSRRKRVRKFLRRLFRW